MIQKLSVRSVAKVLRREGLSVVTGNPTTPILADIWIVGCCGVAVTVLLGDGCRDTVDQVRAILDKAGIRHFGMVTDNQILISNERTESF